MLGRSVVLDAPFLSYFLKRNYVNELSEKYDWKNIKLLVLQVTIDFSVLKERLMARALDRDRWKLANWDTFVQSIQVMNWGPRSPLVLRVSQDNGLTWGNEVVLEEEEGEYSYPAIIAQGNQLFITYTWKRKSIAYRQISVS